MFFVFFFCDSRTAEAELEGDGSIRLSCKCKVHIAIGSKLPVELECFGIAWASTRRVPRKTAAGQTKRNMTECVNCMPLKQRLPACPM